MMHAIATATIAGLAAAASAQTLTIEFTASDATVTENATVTWTMTASWTGGISEFDYFSVVNVHLVGLGTARGTSSPMIGLGWANPALGGLLHGTPSGTSLNDVFAAQQPLFDGVISGSPFPIGQFDVTYDSPGDAFYSVSNRDEYPAFSVLYRASAGDIFDAPTFYDPHEVTLISDTVTVTPAPSVLVPLALCGLIAGRRRRTRI